MSNGASENYNPLEKSDDLAKAKKYGFYETNFFIVNHGR